jgi:hypothetical protein
LINIIATPAFLDKYLYINASENKFNYKEKYLKCLEDWNLISEMQIVKDEEKIIEKVKLDKRLMRIFNQPILKDGVYNTERSDRLKNIL